MFLTIITKLSYSKTSSSDKNDTYEENNCMINLVVNAMAMHNVILDQTIEIQSPILVYIMN